MLVASGIVTRVEIRGTKFASSIHFTIQEVPSKFVYTSILPSIWRAEQLIKPGTYIEIEYTNVEQPIIWSLRASRGLIFNPSEALDSYRKDGLMGIVAVIFFIAISLYSTRIVFRRYLSSRRYF